MRPENKDLLCRLTLQEKVALLEGYESWMTNSIPRVGLPSVYLTDGPTGVRRKAEATGNGVMGLGASYPSTAFPTAVSIANSWDEDIATKVGRAIGEECVGYDVSVLLGPGVNLQRDPRCGRNFEYYSEDPLLSGKLAAAFVRGLQSTGTAACPKHFALNNCENHRYMSNSVVDQRAARELYLKAFEICVREGKPRAMMCAYNQINGIFCSENRWLLTDILRNEWGFDGVVMTDWGATRDRVAGVDAGLDLDMPGGIWSNRKAVIQTARNGSLPMTALDSAAGNVLKLVLDSKTAMPKPDDMQSLLAEHDAFATDIAADCAVLLKNAGVLPLNRETGVLAVGDLFRKLRYQGAGSSGLTPAFLTTPEDAFARAGVVYDYCQGYHEINAEKDDLLHRDALKAAAEHDIVLFFGGLTGSSESEGLDREDLSIPSNQLALLADLCSMDKKVIEVLFGGSPMELPFEEQVSAILYMALPGQGGGEACRKLLYGETNPAGKLSETWMKTCEDIPFGELFSKQKVEQYRESIFVGYRFFDKAPEKIRYPFGFGLSYTSFAYDDLRITQQGGIVTATVTVSNIGEMAGKETAQLYVGRNVGSHVFKAEKELKAYRRVTLAPGESKTLRLQFQEAHLSYFNKKTNGWVLENGRYPVFVGASSQDIRLIGEILIAGQPEVVSPYSDATMDAYAKITDCQIPDKAFEDVIGYHIPAEPALVPYTMESPISDYQNTRMGRFLYKSIMKGIAGNTKKIEKLPEGTEKDEMLKNQQFVLNLVPKNSPRSLIQSGGGRMQMDMAEAITEFANGHVIRAIKAVSRKDTPLPLPIDENRNGV